MDQKKFLAVTGSTPRWFWAGWVDTHDGQPIATGYAVSKNAALLDGCNALGVNLSEANLLPREFADRWRGLNQCQGCRSSDLAIGPGSGKHRARLTCNTCGRFLKWLGSAQLESLPSNTKK